MLPLLIVLDDWEGLVAASDCWKKLQNIAEVKFYKEHLDQIPSDMLAKAEFLMALRERTALNDQLFEKMPRLKLILQTVLINTSRGTIIDEDSLIVALQQNHLAGAGLDVFVQEPLPVTSPLRALKNVIITPHIGWTVEEVFENLRERVDRVVARNGY